MDRNTRRRSLDALKKLNEIELSQFGDPETQTRISQYELAYRMQIAVPEVMDISKEPKSIHEMYGTKPGQKAFGNNCLLARRLVESGVRFVQLYHWGWDSHGESQGNDLRYGLVDRCKETDQGCAALIKDLKQRGLLDSTLIVWGGEFGRTVYCQGTLTEDNYGRDHHPRCFTVWLTGGGIKGGVVHGETDEYSYNIVRDPVHVHDLHATMLHCLGIDHRRLTFMYQGRHHRLTDVHGNVVRELLV